MTANTRPAFIAAHNLFTMAAFPFGTGVIAEATERAAQARSIRQPALLTHFQWYHIRIPPEDRFFHLAQAPREQPFPVLHRLMSRQSLSALFYDDYTRFTWQLAAFLNDTPREEGRRIGDDETNAFFHARRELLLALPSGGAFMSHLSGDGMREDGKRISSFFNFLGIAGIQFDDSGETRFLIVNARTGVTVTSLHRERILPGQGEHHE